MELEKIYKKTKTGATQVWWQELDGSRYRTHSGQAGGKITVSEWTVAVPKNIGRANASTAESQAELEVEANYKLKRKGGYFDDLATAQANMKFEPMSAKSYSDPKTGLVQIDRDELDGKILCGWVWSQPKIDGVRCVARANGLWTRTGEPITSMPHVIDALQPVFRESPNFVVDSELYCHGMSLQRIVGLVRQREPTEECLQVQLWAFDTPGPHAFSRRFNYLDDMLQFANGAPELVQVPTVRVNSLSHLDEVYTGYLAEDYEGQMIRIDGAGYENRRSWNLIKRKEFSDAEFKILAIHEGIGNRTGMAGRVVLDLGNGLECKSNIKGERAFLRDVLKRADSLVGRTATVRFFRWTDDGLLFQPRVIAIHEKERL